MHNTRERERQGRLGMRFYELSEYGIIGSLDTKRERVLRDSYLGGW